ncbi:helix-turn-helix transcriptional regulator [Enterococcus durans]|uniref:helix-turn-helix transcriptional regulator n=1 Tax=Enterococcus durans TaxID=53345 RepID=UPI00115C0538|nr:helix-turn-helix transcriptional regulator [Enterococcus durans]
MINVSYKIKSERLKNNFTEEDLAEKIFVSRQTISSWENGRSLPNYENLVLLSKLFNIPIDHFYSAPDLEKNRDMHSDGGKHKSTKSELWNVGLIILLVISVFIPYSAPISLCVLFTWKEKVTPKFFTTALFFIIFVTTLEVLVTIFVLTHFLL